MWKGGMTMPLDLTFLPLHSKQYTIWKLALGNEKRGMELKSVLYHFLPVQLYFSESIEPSIIKENVIDSQKQRTDNSTDYWITSYLQTSNLFSPQKKQTAKWSCVIDPSPKLQ